MIHVVNFYNDVDDASSLLTLTSLLLDPLIPTILLGDFNLHSASWSPPGLPPSPKAAQFETWAAEQTLTLLTSPGDITCHGRDSEHPSTLNLTWHNYAMEIGTPITPPTIDWPASLGSDHAGICSSWIPDHGAPSTHLKPLHTYRTTMDQDTEEKWHVDIAASFPELDPLPPLTTPTLIDREANRIQQSITDTCDMHMGHKRQPGAHARQWWTEECSDAATNVQQATETQDPNEIKRCRRCLKAVIKSAKHTWADEIILNGNVWDVAKWRHGQKLTNIPALRDADGSLTFDQNRMTSLLKQRFFVDESTSITARHPDDLPA